jgi:hypothetical protein
VPTTEELRGAVFAPGTTFRVKEKVAVPRSRGGFTLGYISKPVPRRHCYVDPTTPISANHQEWRVRELSIHLPHDFHPLHLLRLYIHIFLVRI